MKDTHKDKVEVLRQTGYYAKGLVYSLIGLLTAMAVFGLGGDIEGKKGVVHFMMALPLGKILVGLVAIGLVCYCLWRIYEVIEDPNGDGSKNRIPTRLRYLYSSFVYAFIAYNFIKPLAETFFDTDSGEGSKKKAALAEILATDWGRWLVGAIAVLVLLQALFQFKLSISGKFMKKLNDEPDFKHVYHTVKNFGHAGYFARAVVFCILTYFLYEVIRYHNADQFKGFDGAFRWLLEMDYGSILVGIVALGFLAYGIFNMAVARYASILID
ncbi:DUF1206 domain-containing protein [Halocola ammonii]